MQIDILTVAAIITALSVILGVPIGAYKIYDRISDKQDEHDRKFAALEEENQKLREERNKEIKSIKKENTVICYALLACLDGLQQLGANHTVPKAHDMLSKHLNQAAHDDDE